MVPLLNFAIVQYKHSVNNNAFVELTEGITE